MLYILYHAGTGRKSIWVSLNATLVRTQLKEYQKDVSTSDKGKSALAEHVQYVTPNTRLREKTLK
jgi:hypothetical protein